MITVHHIVALASLVASIAIAARCPVTDGINTITGLDVPKLFSGFNDVLGPVQTLLPFGATSVISSLEQLHVGLLRHPGGTVANFWAFVNGTYISQCEKPGWYDVCEKAEQISHNGLPPSEKFTPAHFAETVGPFLAPTQQKVADVLPIVFDLNLLTLDPNETLSQIDLLASSIPRAAARVRFVELGNEYHLTNKYSWIFPNSSVYIARFRPVIARIREKLPGALIAVATRGGEDPAWDSPIAEALRDNPKLFDAITYHDYSFSGDVMLKKGNESLALYGAAHLPRVVRSSCKYFGASLPIWMTEYNAGKISRQNLMSHNLAYSVLHALFSINYILSAACETGRSIDILMLHLLWATESNWGTGCNLVQLPNNGSTAPAYWSPMGQLYAHMNEYSVGGKYSHVSCWSSSSTCPIGHSRGEAVACLRGARFFNPGNNNSFAGVFTNGCEGKSIDATDIPIATAPVDRTLNGWIYFHWQGIGPHPWRKATADCPVWWRCGPVKPKNCWLRVPAGASTIRVEVPPLSVLVFEVE